MNLLTNTIIWFLVLWAFRLPINILAALSAQSANPIIMGLIVIPLILVATLLTGFLYAYVRKELMPEKLRLNIAIITSAFQLLYVFIAAYMHPGVVTPILRDNLIVGQYTSFSTWQIISGGLLATAVTFFSVYYFLYFGSKIYFRIFYKK